MERRESDNRMEHVIDITGNGNASASSAPHDRHSDGVETSHHEDRASDRARASLTSETSVYVSNSRSTSARSADRRSHRSPSYSDFWIFVELAFTMSQIIAAVIVLSLTRHEHPQSPLFIWIVGYASGCVATLPLLFWQYLRRNQISERNSTEPWQSSQVNLPAGPFFLSLSRVAVESHSTGTTMELTNARVKVLMEYLRTASDYYFVIWFFVGTIWVFGGHLSASDAPNLYRLCIVFLAISFIGYVMPVILSATIFCCLPWIIAILRLREELTQEKGATTESINTLPIYKFKMKENKNGDDASTAEGEVIAAGSSKERLISREDAVCSICLAEYVNNDELRELPCSHLFQKECVDQWLKINASCPLCKTEVGQTVSAAKASRQQRENLFAVALG